MHWIKRSAIARVRLLRLRWKSRRGSNRQILRRRFVLVLGPVAVAVGFALAFPSRAKGACELTGIDLVSDACALVGIPDLPSRTERLTWEQDSKRSCEGLERYLKRYPEGAFSSEARLKLASAVEVADHDWTSFRRVRKSYVGLPETPFRDDRAAGADAYARAREDAKLNICEPVTASERLAQVEEITGIPRCRVFQGGRACSLDYRVTCLMKAKRLRRTCL